MKQVNETLELNKVIEQLKHLTSCSLGKDHIERMAFFTSYDALVDELKQTEEIVRLCYAYGPLLLGGLHDLSHALAKSEMDGRLSPDELLDVVGQVDCAQHVKSYGAEAKIEVPYFRDAVDRIVVLKNLRAQIERCIAPNGEILDGASSKLAKLRRQIRSTEASIQTRMSQYLVSMKDYLSENLVTRRNDRFVIPVKSGYQHQVRGIVHAQSSSHQTLYIEPEAIVQLNNQLQSLHAQEYEEMERILLELSGAVKQESVQLRANQDLLGELDFRFAKGIYAKEMEAVIPEISQVFDRFLLKKARHPLLDPKTVVANTIDLANPIHMLLVTGSNTGGKTVTLKTVGLLAAMALSGMAVPCERAIIPFFDEIFVDLGDEQSIEQSLSTFSSHMSRIVSITENVTSHSLVLMDEVGSGTDPREGESIAQAILEYLQDYHCYVIATTHYAGLKNFAKRSPDILVASVAFDEKLFQPTYRLVLGESGKSYALEISRRLGLLDKIVNRARIIKQENQSDQEALLEKLEVELQLAREKEEHYQAELAELAKAKEALAWQQENLSKRQERYLQEAQKKANALVDEARQTVDMLVADFKAKGAEIKMHEINETRQALASLKKEEVDPKHLPADDHVYKPGDTVRILSMNREGEVLEVKKDQLIVSLGGIKMKLKKEDVRFVRAKVKKVPVRTRGQNQVKKTGSYEINVIGMRYEEAMRVVDKFLDDALMLGYPSVRIIHGMGTGALKNGVSALLKKNKHVASFRSGGPQEGGLGATVAYFH